MIELVHEKLTHTYDDVRRLSGVPRGLCYVMFSVFEICQNLLKKGGVLNSPENLQFQQFSQSLLYHIIHTETHQLQCGRPQHINYCFGSLLLKRLCSTHWVIASFMNSCEYLRIICDSLKRMGAMNPPTIAMLTYSANIARKRMKRKCRRRGH